MSKDANPPASDDPAPVPAKPAASGAGQVDIAELTRERDHYRNEALKLSKLAKSRRAEVETLTAANRQHRHAKAWSDAAAKAGVKADLIDDAWTLSGYKPDADEPDPKKIGDVFKSLKETRPWLFGEAAKPAESGSGEAAPPASPPPPPASGPGTGKTAPNGSASRSSSYADLQNAAYVFNRKPGQVGSISKPS